MSSFTGLIHLNDIDSEGKLVPTRIGHAIIEIEDVDGEYTIFLKFARYRLDFTYLVRNLGAVKFHEEIGIVKFIKPKHGLVLMSDNADKLKSFLKYMRSLWISLKKNMNKLSSADVHKLVEYVNDGIEALHEIDVTHLTMILLENCYLPHLPEAIGDLTLITISLNGSRINTSKDGQDLFWDWMTKHNISTSLNVLDMDSIGLKELPFEIIHLKHLKILTVSNNKLTHIPHFIGELPKLKSLMVDGNSIKYFPKNLLNKVFHTLNISNNRFADLKLNHEEQREYFKPSIDLPPKLSDFSILSLINNCVKFTRQEIPRPLWNGYDFVCRCIACKKLFVFNEQNQIFIYAPPNTEQMMQVEKIHWQYFACIPCVLRDARRVSNQEQPRIFLPNHPRVLN